MIRFKLFVIGFLFCCLSIDAQTKNEKEFRISLSEFPQSSQDVIQSISQDVKRTRFYKEIDGDHESYESKFKYEKRWYSVEFDKNGHLEDIEVTIKEKNVEKSAKASIDSYLNANSSKHNFIKIQEQYIPSDTDDPELFLKQVVEIRESMPSNYEIVVALKQNKEWIILEITFDPDGSFLGQRTIKQDSYEYIMY